MLGHLAGFPALVLFATSIRLLALGIIMPVYTENSWHFNAAYEAAEKVPFIAIINPDDGPGWSRLTPLRNFSNGVRARGGEVVGYINSYFGGLSWDEAEEQMDNYIAFYNVQGFFIDEVANNRSSYYNTMKGRASGKYLVLNPGANLTGYTTIGKIITTYENPQEGHLSPAFADFSSNLASSGTHSAAIVYSVGNSISMRQCVDRALAQGYDWIYITDDGGTNPFDSVPSYWTEEINYIARANLPPPVPDGQFILSISLTGNGSCALTCPTALGRTYEIQISSELLSWTTATKSDDTPAQAVAGGTTLAMTVKTPPGTKAAFFRAVDSTP